MAVYKVPQDVEAEDKFLGPLTFKQFLFGGGALVSGYIVFLFYAKGAYLPAAMFLPFFVAFAALAFPWSKDQPTEIWLAARIRFLLVPRKRIWDQSGIKDLVTITVPKREVHIYTDGLTQDQVRTRLNALASVVDTRGWAIKNTQTRPDNQHLDAGSDRLVITAPALDEASTIVSSTTDIMDGDNTIARQFDDLMVKAEDKHHKQTMAIMEEARQHAQQSATVSSQPPQSAQQSAPVQMSTTATTTSVVSQQTAPIGMGSPVSPTSSVDEQRVLEHIHQKQAQDRAMLDQNHMKVLAPIRNNPPLQQGLPPVVPTGFAPIAAPVDPAILDLANNDDLNVETLARQANKGDLSDEEVVMSLR